MHDKASALFKKIRRIQLHATRLAQDVLAGAYRSAFKGIGMEFEEVREYQDGDDVRNIDWNVTARMNRPYIKRFREEREMTVNLIVDISSSTNFGSGVSAKKDIIAEIAALIAFAAIKNQDKVALILFSKDVEKYFPPKNGSRHVLRIIRELLTTNATQPGTDVGAALSFLGRVQRRTSICFLFSDFMCADFASEASLIAAKHDLVAFAITDPAESHFPDMSLVEMQDLESGSGGLVDTSSTEIKQSLQVASSERLAKQKKLAEQLGEDFMVIDTSKDYLLQMRKFFQQRQKRRR